MLAESSLTAAARLAIRNLLGPGESLADVPSFTWRQVVL
jgi:hypothetical protein